MKGETAPPPSVWSVLLRAGSGELGNESLGEGLKERRNMKEERNYPLMNKAPHAGSLINKERIRNPW